MISRDAGLRPFTRDAVIEIIRFGARRAAQKDKLLTRFSEVADLLRESDYFAAQETAAVVTAEHVRRTLHDRRRFRWSRGGRLILHRRFDFLHGDRLARQRRQRLRWWRRGR